MAITVNGEHIEDEAIQREAERMRPRFDEAFADEEPEAREARLLEWARENVIERTLLAQEATRDPRPVPAKDIEEALEELKKRGGPPDADEETRAHLELRLRIDRLLEKLCENLPAPSGQAIQQFYDAHKQELMAPEQIRVAHIVKHVDLSTDPEAARNALAAVCEELERGADFAEMARKHSDCPENGGDLGYFARGQMVEEFELLVFSLPVGQLSGVFPTRFGFHVAKVLDRKPRAPYPLDDVRDHIREQLISQRRNKAIEDHLDQLRAKATIEGM